jgi:DNA-3-methyladenine glycosylase I
MKRCSWCGKDELYVKYHDEEWGLPYLMIKNNLSFLY